MDNHLHAPVKIRAPAPASNIPAAGAGMTEEGVVRLVVLACSVPPPT